MKGQKYLLVALFLILNLVCFGCIGRTAVVIPKMDLPLEPKKPAIKSMVVPYQNSFLVGYSVADAMKLLEWEYKRDAYEEKLRYRINIMNEVSK